MNDTQQLAGRPDFRPQMGTAKSSVVARLNDHSIAPEAGSSDLLGLVNGLQQLNPELAKVYNQYTDAAREETADKFKANAYKVQNPRDALTGNAPITVPEDVPPAFGPMYVEGFKNVLAQRSALEVSNDIESKYMDQRDLPDFNAKAFLDDEQRKALAGLTDPTQIETMGRHFDEVKARLMAADTQRLVRQHEETRKSTMAELTTNALKPDQTPQELFEKAQWLVDQGAAIQVHPDTSIKAVLDRVRSMSMDAEGKPELFDLFDKPNADGRTLRMLAPDLGDAIDVAKQHARTLRDKATMEATMGDRFEVIRTLDKLVDENPDKVTAEVVKPYIGKFGLSEEKAASYLNQARDKLAHKQLFNDAMAGYDQGILGRYEPGIQQKVLEAHLGPTITAAWRVFSGQGAADPATRQATIQSLAESIMQAHSRARATVPVDGLKGLVTSTISALPNPEGPTPGFQAVAELHKALSANPQYRDMYFKGDADDLMRTYNTLTTVQHLDPQTAYTKAYLLNSPEQKEAMAAKAQDPTFIKNVEASAKKAVEGSTMFSLWGLMNGRPQNDSEVGAWAGAQIKAFWKANPHLSEEDVQDKVGRMVRENWVMDGVSRQAIKVPTELSGPNTQAAFTDLTKTLVQKYKSAGSFPPGSYIRYAPMGDEGTYKIEVWSGSRVESRGVVGASDLIRQFNVKSNLQPAEAQQLRDAVRAVRNGEAVPSLDPQLVAKGVSAGFIDPWDKRLFDMHLNKGTFQPSNMIDLGDPTGDSTLENARGFAKIDPKLTAKTATELAFKDGQTAPHHLDLAASLAATREGISLTAYTDPARGAGLNIGAGYNLKANATTVAEDLKAVGVPENRVEDIKRGKASLTPEQAKWLTQLAVKRMEPQVQKVAEGVKPGLWNTLTPQQRAVMIDVAYQTGDAGQYRKAWAALSRGDKVSFQHELRTFYTPNGTNAKVEDKRSLDLRASMLQGPSAWKARLMVASK